MNGTNKMLDPVREQFEAWHKRNIQGLIASGHVEAARSLELLKDSMHHCWQASRQAVVVELPSPNNDYTYPDRDISGACEHHRRAVAAIEAQGLRVGVKD